MFSWLFGKSKEQEPDPHEEIMFETTRLELRMKNWSDPLTEPWLWPNFTPKEMASRGNGEVFIKYEALNKLQALRTAWGRPLTINSAYRDPAYNVKVGGATSSKHMEGMAFDISVVGWTAAEKKEFKELAYSLGFKGFGGYNSFIHVDIHSKRRWGQQWAWPEELK